jgi:hypothetical protein
MADVKRLLELFERGVWMFFDVPPEFFRVQFPPMAPTGLGRQGARLLGGQIAVHRPPTQRKTPGRLGFGPAFLNEGDDSLPQIKAVCFHAGQSITLCANINMKYYIADGEQVVGRIAVQITKKKFIDLCTQKGHFLIWQNRCVCL